MLKPGQCAQLNRETALAALDELVGHQERQRRARRLVAELHRLVDEGD